MKKILLLVAASLVWGCSSQPVDDSKAAVEERTPGAAEPVVPPPPGPTSKPLPPGTTPKPVVQAPQPVQPGTSPLKDPKSILSRRSVFYDYDSDAIKDEFRDLVQAHAKYLASNAGAKMLIQGNCDERGSREYNIALGQRRAEALKRMLVLLGARDGQIESVSLGEEKPRCEEHTEACMSQNRRSDMLYGGEF